MAGAAESMRALFTLHSDIPREGPGSDASTRRAIEKLRPIASGASILDIGCGPGKQSLVLAQALPASVTAVDLNQPYLDRLDAEASRRGLSGRIKTLNASLDALPFPEKQFDLIWAEGSVFILGVSQCLKLWRPLLKSQGQIGFSELTWLTDTPPAEAARFWEANYPQMATTEGNLKKIAAEGFEVIDTFVLPASDWWDEYLSPLEKRIESLRGQAASDPALAEVLESAAEENRICARFGESFSYVFYLAAKL